MRFLSPGFSLILFVSAANLSFADKTPLTVEQAVRLALTNRLSVRSAESRLKSAQATQSALSAPGATRLETGKGTEPGYGFSEDLLLAQPIDVFGKTAANRSLGQAGVLGARSALAQARLDAQSDAISAFNDAQVAESLVTTGQDIADIAEKSYSAAQKKVDAGELAPAELLRIDLERQRARQTLNLRLRTVEASRIRLATALGISLDQIDSISAQIPDVKVLSLENALKRRPDLLQTQSEIDSASADARIAKVSRLPDLELQFRRTYWDDPEAYNARVQLTLQLFDFGAARNRLSAANHAKDAANETLRDRIALAKSEVQASRLELDAARQSVDSFTALISDARTIQEKLQRGYLAGANTLLDVLDATRSLRDVEESAIDARSKLLQATSHYLSATGTILEINR